VLKPVLSERFLGVFGKKKRLCTGQLHYVQITNFSKQSYEYLVANSVSKMEQGTMG